MRQAPVLTLCCTSDDGNGRVCELDAATGKRLRVFRSKGAGAGTLHGPFGVALWRDLLLVTEYGGGCVSVFSLARGTYLQ